MKIIELLPGMKVGGNTYIAQQKHPLHGSLQLAVWILRDGRIKLDAVSPGAEVGTPDSFNPQTLTGNLRLAMKRMVDREEFVRRELVSRD